MAENVHQEIFKATIRIELPNIDKLNSRIASIAKTAETTMASVQKAFDQFGGESFSGIDAAARRFGQALAEIGKIGPRGGTSEFLSADITKMAQAIRDFEHQTGMSLPQITGQFDKLGLAIAANANVSQQAFEDKIRPGLEKVAEMMKGKTVEIGGAWRGLSQLLVGGSIVPDMVTKILGQLARLRENPLEQFVRDTKTAFEGIDNPIQNFSRAMNEMNGDTKNFRDGLTLMQGGQGLRGLRTMFIGTAGDTKVLGRAFSFVERAVAKHNSTLSKAEKTLLRHSSALQDDSVILRNSINQLKDHAKVHGLAAAKVSQLTESIRYSMNMTRQSYQAAMAKKEITEQGIAAMKNSVAIMRQELVQFKKNNAEHLKGNEGLRKMLEGLEKEIARREQAIKTIASFNKVTRKQHQEEKEATKEAKKHGTAIKKLGDGFKGAAEKAGFYQRGVGDAAGKTKILSGSVRAATGPLRSLSGAVDLTNRSLFKLVGMFTMTYGAAGLLRKVFRSVASSVRTFKDEILGFGVAKGFFDQLTTGTVEYAAKVNQAEFAVQQMGKRMAETWGVDGPSYMDFLSKKAVELQAQGIGIAESFDLIKKSLALGKAPGNLGVEPDEILKSKSSIVELTAAFKNQEIGLETVARAAQNWAAVYGGNSSEIAMKFMDASTRMKTEILEVNGIAKNASVLIEEWAEAHDRNVASMKDEEKQLAVLVGVIRQTLPATGAYNEAMGDSMATVGKLLGSMTRYVNDAKYALGNLFMPVLKGVAEDLKAFFIRLKQIAESDAAKRIADGIGKVVSRMNVISPILRFVTNNFESLADTILGFGDAISRIRSGDMAGAFESFRDATIGAITHVAMFIDGMVGKAVSWGWNLVSNLATGIIDAAGSILSSAASLVGDILGMFFAPGSPPKKGPLSRIDEWGAGLMSAMGEGMAGSATAVFANVAGEAEAGLEGAFSDIFRNLDLSSFKLIKDAMGPIRSIFQSMISTGGMEETQLVPALVEARELMAQLADEFEETGIVSEEMLDKIASGMGDAGEDMKKYIKLQFELQKAKDDLEAIDKEIATHEEAGFVPAKLRARKKDAIERIKTLDEQFQLQKELLSWQQESNNLVKQQIDLLKRIADQNERATKAGAKGQKDQWQAFLETYNKELAALETKKALGIITEEEYQRGRLSLEQRYIDTAIRLNKPLDDARVQAFKNLQEQVKSLTGGGAGGMETLEKKALDVGDAMAKNLESLLGFEDAKKSVGGVSEAFGEMREKVTGAFDAVKDFLSMSWSDRLQGVIDWLKDKLPSGLMGASGAIEGTFTEIFNKVAKNIIPILGGAVTAAFVLPGLGGIASSFGGTALRFLGPLGKILKPILGLFGKLATLLLGPVLGALKAVGVAVYGALGPFGTAILVIGGLVAAFMLLKDKLGLSTDDIKKKLKGIVAGIRNALTPLVIFFKVVFDRVLGLLKRVVESVGDAIGRMVERFRKMESLKRLFERLAPILKAVAIVVGAILVGALIFLVGAIEGVAAAMEPMIDVVADVIDWFAKLASYILGAFAGTFEILYLLFTLKPKEAFEKFISLGVEFVELVISTFRVIPKVILGLMKTFLEGLIGFVDGAVEFITGQSNTIAGAVKPVIDVVDSLSKGISYATGDMSEGMDKSRGAIASWSEEADGMVKAGHKASDIVDVLAGRVNKAREEFDKGGALVAVFAGGKDIDIFNESAQKTNDILLDITDTYEGYTSQVKRYNEQTEVEEMNIDAVSEAMWEMKRGLKGASDESQRAHIFLKYLTKQEGLLGEAAREAMKDQDLMAEAIGKVTGASVIADAALIESTRRKQASAQASKDIETAEKATSLATVAAMSQTTGEVARMLGEQSQAYVNYKEERKRLVLEGNAEELVALQAGNEEELVALKEGNAEKLAALDERYAKESIARKEAQADALLDLNEYIMKEALAKEGLTGTAAAAIVERHRQQAQEIVDHYGIESDAAQRMAETSAEAITAAMLSNEDFRTNVDLSLGDAMDLFDNLQTYGYDALSTKSKATIDEMIVGLALWQKKNGDTMGDITTTLGALPQEYQNAVLKMLDSNATIEQIIDALNGLDRTITPKVEMSVSLRGKDRKLAELQSPKTALQLALESLVAFTTENPIVIDVMMREGLLEQLDALSVGIVELGESGAPAGKMLGRTVSVIDKLFSRLQDRVTGSSGSMTMMMASIKRLFRNLSAVYGILGQFKSAVQSIFNSIATHIKATLSAMFGYAGSGGLLDVFHKGGFDIMKQLADGIYEGGWLITRAVDWIIEQVIARLNSIGGGGPQPTSLSYRRPPDLRGLTAGGLGNRIGSAGGANTLIFERGAFEGAFPGVTNAEGFEEALLGTLNNITRRSTALSRFGG